MRDAAGNYRNGLGDETDPGVRPRSKRSGKTASSVLKVSGVASRPDR